MTSPLDYLDEDGADEADYESPMRELYAYRDGDTWLDGIVTGVRPNGSGDGGALVQFDGRLWVPAREVKRSSHYIAVLLNPDSEVYAEVIQSYVDDEPKQVIRDVSKVGDDNVGTEWRPLDEAPTGTRVRYRYTGTAELQEPDDEEESA
jgi:hypothetical protein